MSRVFNGTSQAMSRALDLSGFSLVSTACWVWWDAFASNDKMMMEYTTNARPLAGLQWDFNSSDGGSNSSLYMGDLSNGVFGKKWARPSAAAWHHYVGILNRATPSIVVYVDGVAVSLSNTTFNSGTISGNFANSTLYLMSRAGTSLFGAGKMAELAVWGGYGLTAGQAASLANGSPPHRVRPDNLILYAPLWGASSPEPDYSGTQKNVTQIGTPTSAAHPAVMPGMFGRRGFQPVPV